MTVPTLHSIRRLLCHLALPALLLAAAPGHAATLTWNTRPFSIVANEKPLPDFLRELAASQGTTAVVDPKVGGVISGKFLASAQAILNSICATNGLTWYHDGSFLFVEPAGDARTEVLSISGGSGARIAETLNRLRITDARYPLTISEREGTLYVSGPKRYVEMVRQAVKLSDQRAVMSNYAEIRMFPLRYAWASDFKINRAGKEITIPGVANVLRSLHPGGTASTAGGPSGGSGAGQPFRVGPNRVLRLASGDTVNAPKVELGTAASGSSGADDAPFNFAPSADLPQFHADTRMNAVMVRDLPDRMPHHARLIESMDARPLLIELELTIMDISSDSLTSLGVDWRLHSRRGDFQSGNGTLAPLTFDGASTEAGQTGAKTPAGGVFTATIGHEARTFLLTRVNALAKNGDANFVARPRVLTLNNTEAILENLNELHVRVQGFQDAGLFSITAGTALRITPMMIDEGAERGVMMSINIEDADLSPVAVDAIPIVRRRAVNTQALVEEGTSLLIAGYSSEEKSTVTSGVPLLSSVPVLGNLFKFSERKRVNMERFYMLTPRLVALRSVAATAPVPPLQGPQPQEPQRAPLRTPPPEAPRPGGSENANASPDPSLYTGGGS
jgi:type III secretion protein C